MSQPNLINPTDAPQRLALLDALRGFALFGIMFVNMTWFTGFAVLPALPADQRIEFGTERIDTVVYWLINWLVDSKFWSLFALLFGVGAAMQWARSEKRGEPFAPMFLRRLLALIAIGLLHAVFLWFGDIVSLYAVVGFALLIFVRASDRTILIWAITLLHLPVIQAGIWQWANPNFDTSHGPYDQLPVFGSGNYGEMFSTNWEFLVKRWILAIYSGRFFQLLGMFLLGYWAARRGVFHEPHRHRRLLIGALVGGLVFGLPANALVVAVATPPSPLAGWLLQWEKAVGVPALCVAYVAGFVLLYQLGLRDRDNQRSTDLSRAPAGMWVFTYAGRMTLTNYVLQSVIGIGIFYGCGLGFWAQIGITQAVLLIVVIYTVQSLISMVWLRSFQQGPLEWVWRCLAYGRILPLRRV